MEQEYNRIHGKFEKVENEIKEIQEFLGEIQQTYFECGSGCTERPKAGNEIDPDYLDDLYSETSFQEENVEEILDNSGTIQTQAVRRLTNLCKEILEDKRNYRYRLLEEKVSLREQIALRRHPKKDSW